MTDELDEILNIDVETSEIGKELKQKQKQAIQALLAKECNKARIEETDLWYNQWGYGDEQIGDGSWEDYHAYRIRELQEKNNYDSKRTNAQD